MTKPEEALGFDPDGLREKYRVEWEKRLRPGGNEPNCTRGYYHNEGNVR